MNNFIPSSNNQGAGCAVQTDYTVLRRGDSVTSTIARMVHGVVRRLRERSARRQALRQLGDLSDEMLRDIGITRADVYSASHLPLSTSATEHLGVLSRSPGRLY